MIVTIELGKVLMISSYTSLLGINVVLVSPASFKDIIESLYHYLQDFGIFRRIGILFVYDQICQMQRPQVE